MDLPSWVQDVTILCVACLSIVIGVYKYVTTQGNKPTKSDEVSGTQVVAASFVDSKLLRELIDILKETQEENARVAARITRSNSELRESIIESTEAARLQADATLNMLRFINRQNQLGGHKLHDVV